MFGGVTDPIPSNAGAFYGLTGCIHVKGGSRRAGIARSGEPLVKDLRFKKIATFAARIT
jgi:hypothetical protein